MLSQKLSGWLCLPILAWAVLFPGAAGQRSNYCSAILRQTEQQEKDCESAAKYYSGGESYAAIMPLMCCLGVFHPNFPVSYVYRDHLDLSLIAYIYKEVRSFQDEEQVAVFVAQCYLKVKPRTPPLLMASDYKCWLGSGRQLCQCG